MNAPVLVLNANYQPLNVCSTARAMGLLVLGKAEIVQNGRGVIRSATRVFERPSVIKLGYMVHRPQPRVRLNKREVFRRDSYTCQYCGNSSARLTLDHVLPKTRGGDYAWQNLVSACPQCNRRKGGRTPQEAGMALRSIPGEPSASAVYLFGRYLTSNGDWVRYLQGW